MMSAKQKRFHSSPPGPHQSPPSVSTPSTSMATARIVARPAPAEFSFMQLDRGANAAEFFDDGELTLVDAFDSVALCLLPQPDVAHQPRNAIRLQRGRMIRSPRCPIHRDVTFYRAGSQRSRADARRNPGLMPRIADGYAIAHSHRRYRPQI